VCDAPAKDISEAAPLPRLTAALEAGQPIKIMTIGSSTTVGIGASSPSKTYQSQLKGILQRSFEGLDITFVNRGISGELAAKTAERLLIETALERPTLVLWQVGTNDALARIPVEDFRQTVTTHVRWLKTHGVDVVLVGLQYTPKAVRDEHYTAIRTTLAEVAKQENVLLVRRFATMQFIEKVKANELLAQDGLHLNDLGYRCMAEHIALAMVANPFLKKPRRRPPPADMPGNPPVEPRPQ
jgi:lysophospholipase L1-like esterase